jgi:opacity protein-like surface antigen
MSNISKGLTLFALGMIVSALPLQAQASRQVEFSLGGGIGVPTGDFDDAFKVGWHGLAAASYSLPNAPLGFQIDGAYSSFQDEAAALNIKENMFYATGNVIYQIKVSEAAAFLPYLIGGGGVYNLAPTGSDAAGIDSRTELGLNLGAGVTVNAGRVGLFVESRFHNVFNGLETSDLQFNNVTAGLRFGPQ